MDRKSWPWKKKSSSEKPAPVTDQDQVLHLSFSLSTERL
ncbi:hypothetical protein HID58_030712 [Brassica napus]|uniref:Uncharacterized protein n=1 Tax=Brassica napus TaxID=3708 RepID=A0ABQ8CIY5_BRANA|nr:hypothetical protein HID58_030712 [Brassica napus]